MEIQQEDIQELKYAVTRFQEKYGLYHVSAWKFDDHKTASVIVTSNENDEPEIH